MEEQLRTRVGASADRLGVLTARAAEVREAIAAAPRDPAAAARIFDAIEGALAGSPEGTAGVTVYDRQAVPVAWAGRVSETARPRIDGPAALFVEADALGPRLVRVEPIGDRDRPLAPRLGTVVAEQLLRDGPVATTPGGRFVLTSLLVPVSIHAPADRAAARPPYTFAVRSAGGGTLFDAEVDPDAVARAHARWHGWTVAALYSILGLALLGGGAAALEARRRTATRGALARGTATVLLALTGARFAFWLAAAQVVGERSITTPLEVLLNALLITAMAALFLTFIERWRVTPPRARLLVPGTRAMAGPVVASFAAGAFDLALLWAYERCLAMLVARSELNLLHFSLHPLNDPSRLSMAFGLVLLHAGIIWTGVLAVRATTWRWRVPRSAGVTRLLTASWIAGAAVSTWIVRAMWGPVPGGPLLVALAAVAVCSLALDRLRSKLRVAARAARLAVLFTALALPAVAMYLSVDAWVMDAKERLISHTFAPEAASQRDTLKRQLDQSLDQIDAFPNLAALVNRRGASAQAATNQAFDVWSATELARSRVTSAIELYGPDGRLVSRFVNLPEYETSPQFARGCGWEAFEEASPFGSSERHVLRASRSICVNDRRVGGIVVRAMLDYRTLPFIASQRPYAESLNPGPALPGETAPGRDVGFAFYGWSRAPLYASSPAVWPLPDAVFDRMVATRDPVWADVERGGAAFRVYFFNDRGGIYALGYPVTTLVGHGVNVAELVILSGALYVILLGLATLFSTMAPGSGRALWSEVRSSFYRKLFLYFVAAAALPVVILAVATRAYFANQFSADVEQDAVKTATVAERLVEDYATLQQRGAGGVTTLDDQIMALVSRAIDEDVSLFRNAGLEATSERDFFASGLLSMRTPSGAYRKIVLEHLPTFVGVENAGPSRYLLAAAPVHAGGQQGLVTVPLALRERESEEQIDELDRQVWAASVLFVLFGAWLGYVMAERIADPVNRLTRATRRIARGDLDARVAVTSSDELRRLVEDFNQMAGDLKRQRAELERTQRLEAWADMARQVAHDIKNPLTPIQLSAEHAQRVNIDRGRPLSPVLDDCVTSILKQVRLLRQISTEFSSFASSPTPRPEPTDVGALVEEVVAPYRTGLSGRVDIGVDAAPGLPPAKIDRTLFARALTNVIENALHAMPGGGQLRIEVAIAPSTDSPVIVVRVTDTGVGMDQESRGRLFEPYFSTKATGTGLGLTIAKRNVELNGGTIAVDSERGVGTTVTMTVPVGERGNLVIE